MSSAPRIEPDREASVEHVTPPRETERRDRTDRVHRIERELPRPFVPSRSVSSATAPYTLLRPFRGPGEAYLAATAAGELCVVQIAPGALQQPALRDLIDFADQSAGAPGASPPPASSSASG